MAEYKTVLRANYQLLITVSYFKQSDLKTCWLNANALTET